MNKHNLNHIYSFDQIINNFLSSHREHHNKGYEFKASEKYVLKITIIVAGSASQSVQRNKIFNNQNGAVEIIFKNGDILINTITRTD